MKRTYIIISAFLMLLTVIPAKFALADSLNVTDEELAVLPEDRGDETIKVFNGFFMQAFASNAGIEELTGENCVLEELYFTVNSKVKGSGACYAIRNGNAESIDVSDLAELDFFLDNAGRGEKLLKKAAPGANVRGVYCLDGGPSNDGLYILFDTDKGAFVLYREYASSDNTYMMPLDDFTKLAVKVCEERQKEKDSIGGTSSVEELFDMEPYRVGPAASPWPIIAAAAGGALIVAAVLLFAKKRAR